jgi:hypothetical protein
MPRQRNASQQNEMAKSVISHRILLPTEKSSIENLESVLASITTVKAYAETLSGGKSYEGIRNQSVPSEKQLEMRIKLRKKLEKKKSKKK